MSSFKWKYELKSDFVCVVPVCHGVDIKGDYVCEVNFYADVYLKWDQLVVYCLVYVVYEHLMCVYRCIFICLVDGALIPQHFGHRHWQKTCPLHIHLLETGWIKSLEVNAWSVHGGSKVCERECYVTRFPGIYMCCLGVKFYTMVTKVGWYYIDLWVNIFFCQMLCDVMYKPIIRDPWGWPCDQLFFR